MLKNLTILALAGALLPACIITSGDTATDTLTSETTAGTTAGEGTTVGTTAEVGCTQAGPAPLLVILVALWGARRRQRG